MTALRVCFIGDSITNGTGDTAFLGWPGELPCAIVFAFGINDATEEDGVIRVPMADSIANARSILSAAKVLHPTLWVGPTPVDETRQPTHTETGQVKDKRNRRTADYNLAFRALADDIGVPYLDMMSALINDPGWPALLSDGLHPAADGYEHMATIIGSWPAWRNLLD